MSVINTNISSIQAQNSLRVTQLNQSTAMERLSSGVRINSAKDDAAGLAISTRMTANIRGIAAAVRNANDGISLTQTAEGSLGQIGDSLQRIRELAVQSANTGNNASDRAAMNNEAKQLIAEIDRVASNSMFNGIKLLDGTFQNQALQVGAGNDSNDRIAISISSARANALGVGSGSGYSAKTSGSGVGEIALAAGALNINGFSSGAAQADGVSSTASSTSGIAVAAAINAISSATKVTAKVGETSVTGIAANGFGTAIGAGDVKINGVSIGPIEVTTSAGGRGGQVAAAVNAVSAQTGVTASFDISTGAVALKATDGRNITVDAVNAGGSSAVTGLGSGTGLSMVGAASTSTTAIAAGTLKVNGVSIGAVAASPSVLTVQGRALIAVPASLNVTPGVAATPTKQVDSVTFVAMKQGQEIEVSGLKFTATAASLTAAEVAAAFANLTSNIDAGTRQATAGFDEATIKGKFTGTFSSDYTSSAAASAVVSFTKNIAADGTTKITTVGSAAATEASTVTFTDLAAGASTTVNGLTFTAKVAVTSAQVAKAFDTMASTGSTAATITASADKATSIALGTYSGNYKAGFTAAALSDTNKVVYTSSTTDNYVADIAVSTKFDKLAEAINAETAKTGVTATNTNGSIALSSTSGISLIGNVAADTGISGTQVSKSTTSRSLVELSSTDSAGINISGTNAAALTAAGLKEGSATVTSSAGAGVSSLDLTTAAGSQAALTTLDSAINTITDSRAAMGAYQNRLTASIANLETTSMNLSASRSRILDTDYAKESTNLAKSQIISQAATAMLAQANQSQQSVLALLK
jgi:flagellin